MRREAVVLGCLMVIAVVACDTGRRRRGLSGQMKPDCKTSAPLGPVAPKGSTVIRFRKQDGCNFEVKCITEGTSWASVGLVSDANPVDIACNTGDGSGIEVECHEAPTPPPVHRTCDILWHELTTGDRQAVSTATCGEHIFLLRNGTVAKVKAKYRIKNTGSCAVQATCGTDNVGAVIPAGAASQVRECEVGAGSAFGVTCLGAGGECTIEWGVEK